MLERLVAEHEVERLIRKRDLARVPVAAGAERRRPAAIDGRLDAGPRPTAQLDDAFAVGVASVADLEHAQVARVAQVRLGGGHHAFAQRRAERDAALDALGIELRATATRDDAL